MRLVRLHYRHFEGTTAVQTGAAGSTSRASQERRHMADTTPSSWFDIAIAALKRNEVKLITFVPDRVLAPLIKGLEADPSFEVISATREEEAVGIVSGAWMGGVRGAVLMQTSGFATLPNVIASSPDGKV